MDDKTNKPDGRKNNHGVFGNKGGHGRPRLPQGARPRRMYSAFDDENILIKAFIKIAKEDMGKAKMMLESIES